jgi:outer membrane protein
MKRSLLAAAILLAAGPSLGDNLIQVYEKAVVNDARIREARATRDAAQELEPLARSLLLPNLSAGGNANVNRFDRKSIDFQDTYTNTSAGVSLTQAVFRRDRWMSLDRSKSQVAQADAQLTAEEQSLIVRTATAYFDVLSAQDTLEFVRAEKKATARELDQAKQRFEVGLDAITSVHEAQSRYDITVADEVTAQFRLDQTWEALRQIISERPARLAGLIEKMPLQPPSPDDENQWSEWAQQNNPAIQAAQHAADAAKKQIEVQRSGHYPTLDAVGSYQINRYQGVDTPFGATSESLADIDRGTIGLQLTIPIYQGGGVEAGTRQAVSQYQAAQDALDGRRREVDKNVRDAFRAVNQTIARVKALQTAIVSTQSALEATQAGYEVGTRTIVDVLNRQRDLFAAQRDYAVARYQHLVASLALKQAAGNITREDVQQVNALLK